MNTRNTVYNCYNCNCNFKPTELYFTNGIVVFCGVDCGAEFTNKETTDLEISEFEVVDEPLPKPRR